MRIAAFLLALGCVARADAQVRIPFDLAGSGALTQSVDPGTLEITIENKLPSAKYDITVRRELIPIAVLTAEGLGSLTAFERGRPEAADACSTLTAAVTQLVDSKAEVDVPSRARIVSDRLTAGGCNEADTVSGARAALEATTRHLAPVAVAAGERVTVTIVRAGDTTGKPPTWTLVLETEPRGEWITTWGVSFVPDDADKFFAKSLEGGKFAITAERDEKGAKPVPSVFFSWLSSKQKRGDWAFSPTAGFGIGGSSPAVFGGVSATYNQNISFIGGLVISGQQRLNGRYEPGQEITENLSDEQLHQRVFRPSAFGAITFRFARNPFKEEEKKDDKKEGEKTGQPATATTPASTPSPGPTGGPVTEAAVRDPDIRLRFDAKGTLLPESQPALAALAKQVRGVTDVFILSHGWWNDVSSADCFYRRMIGGLRQHQPSYLTPERFRPLFVTIYWPSAVFPLEPSDCADSSSAGRQEASGSSPLGADEIRRWATGAFPDAVGAAEFPAELRAVTTLLQKERTTRLAVAEGAELTATLVRWHQAAGAAKVPVDGIAPELFEGTASQIAEAWRKQPESRQEAGLPGFATKWVSFGNAFTFWSMKQRAGVVGSQGVHAVLASLQAARKSGTRVHLIGHSFGGKVLSAALTGHRTGVGNRADSFVVLQGAFSQFAFATRDQITQLGVSVTSPGLYVDVIGGDLVAGPLVVTHSTADVPNRVLYPAGVAIVNDVLESSRAARFGSLGASGLRGPVAVTLDLATQPLRAIEPSPRRVNVDASGVILGHSDLVKPKVFALIWDAFELASAR